MAQVRPFCQQKKSQKKHLKKLDKINQIPKDTQQAKEKLKMVKKKKEIHERWYTTGEIAHRLGVSRTTVLIYCKNGTIESRLVGSTRRISDGAFQKYLEECERRAKGGE